MGEVLTFEALHAALSRCMAAHPPDGAELRLHPDANTLAGLWGLMSYEKTHVVPLDQVKPAVIDAYSRWRVEPGGPQ